MSSRRRARWSTGWTGPTSTSSDGIAVAAYLAELGSIDVLVNCAGGVVGQVHRPIEEVTDEAWNAVVDANLRSTFVMSGRWRRR